MTAPIPVPRPTGDGAGRWLFAAAGGLLLLGATLVTLLTLYWCLVLAFQGSAMPVFVPAGVALVVGLCLACADLLLRRDGPLGQRLLCLAATTPIAILSVLAWQAGVSSYSRLGDPYMAGNAAFWVLVTLLGWVGALVAVVGRTRPAPQRW